VDEFVLGARLLLLLGVANAAPILAKRLLGSRWGTPLDGGARCFDGRRVLGPTKTLRGVAAAVLATALASAMLGMPGVLGALVGAATMAGDALSSFLKRRLGVPPSGKATGLDQVPEALLPLLAVRGYLELSALEIGGITLAFFLIEIPVAKLGYRLGLRDTPH
jgi:CDP-2,3-bis-(O-geranylgeranyl)-sn-glycerol synthase